MEGFALEYIRPPHKITMRIYRDIRFSKNKLPYKTHLSACWARRGIEKTFGGGFYLQISPKDTQDGNVERKVSRFCKQVGSQVSLIC